jgi:hypothetical protein
MSLTLAIVSGLKKPPPSCTSGTTAQAGAALAATRQSEKQAHRTEWSGLRRRSGADGARVLMLVRWLIQLWALIRRPHVAVR